MQRSKNGSAVSQVWEDSAGPQSQAFLPLYGGTCSLLHSPRAPCSSLTAIALRGHSGYSPFSVHTFCLLIYVFWPMLFLGSGMFFFLTFSSCFSHSSVSALLIEPSILEAFFNHFCKEKSEKPKCNIV